MNQVFWISTCVAKIRFNIRHPNKDSADCFRGRRLRMRVILGSIWSLFNAEQHNLAETGLKHFPVRLWLQQRPQSDISKNASHKTFRSWVIIEDANFGQKTPPWWQILMFRTAENLISLSNSYSCAKTEHPASDSFHDIVQTWRDLWWRRWWFITRRGCNSSATFKLTFLSLFSVLVQWKNYPRAFLLPEHQHPPFWPQWQSISATPSNKTHRLCQSVALYRAHALTDSQPPSRSGHGCCRGLSIIVS